MLPHLTPQKKKKIIKKSNELHQEFLEKGLIVKHELANNYIQSIANRIAPSFEHPEIKLNYYILKDASINASALPNGNIYLNVGLISKLSSEDQLAFVMAHEIAHVIERHGLKKKIDLKNTMVTSHVANFVLMGTNLIYLATISDLASFSRKTEGEADYEAMKYITKSAYSLDEGKESLVRLRQVKYKKEEASAWATHKDLNQRVLDFEQKKQKHDWVSSLAPSDNHVYEQFRSAVAEQVVKIRIRGKLFELAADVVEQELALQSNSAMWHFYLAEVNRLKAMEVTEYAKEYSWLHDIDNDEKLLLELEGKKNNLLATAKKVTNKHLRLMINIF